MASEEPLPLKLSLTCCELGEDLRSGWELPPGLGGAERFVATASGDMEPGLESPFPGDAADEEELPPKPSLSCLAPPDLAGSGWDWLSDFGGAERFVATGEGGEMGVGSKEPGMGSGRDEIIGWRSVVGSVGAAEATGTG